MNFDYSLVPITTRTNDGAKREIRLLEISPSDHSVALWCTLQVYDLATAPVYEALSYTWGDPEPQSTVYLNGSYVLKVRQNLFAALNRLRRKSSTRLFWIDALCVDQSNVKERNHTVAFMREIYASARGGVVVWFGEEDADTGVVQGFLDRLTDRFDSRDDQDDRPEIRAYRLRTSTPYKPPPLTDPGYRALYNLLLTPWSSRVWVVQEIVMAPSDPEIRIVKGSFSFRMEQIALAMSAIYKHQLEQDLGYSYPARFATIWVERTLRKESPNMLDIMVRNWMTYASDARDKIYGLLGLSREHALNIDYGTSMKVEQVFTDFARHCISKDRDLTILGALSSSTKNRMSTLPSWVPDWTTWNPDTFLFLPDRSSGSWRRYDHFKAAGNASSAAFVLFPRETPKEMRLEGHMLTEISHVGPVFKERDGFENKISLLSECERIAGIHNELTAIPLDQRATRSKDPAVFDFLKVYPPTRQSLLEAYYATLTMDGVCHWRASDHTEPSMDNVLHWQLPHNTQSMERAKRLQKIYSDFHILCLKLRDRDLVDASGEYLAPDRDLFQSWKKHYNSAGISAAANRRMVRTTASGFIGLFCEHVKVGDKIVVLKGARVPLAIRRSTKYPPQEGLELWEIVGDGYLHGVMNGEAWKRERCRMFRFI